MKDVNGNKFTSAIERFDLNMRYEKIRIFEDNKGEMHVVLRNEPKSEEEIIKSYDFYRNLILEQFNLGAGLGTVANRLGCPKEELEFYLELRPLSEMAGA
ncbi:TPA: hypothetical protein ACGO1T_001774 [Streptococcus suis]